MRSMNCSQVDWQMHEPTSPVRAPSYIRGDGLAAFAKFKYSGSDASLIAKHILQPYWQKVVTFMPMWLAPNLITLLGLLVILANTAMIVYCEPKLGSAPELAAGRFMCKAEGGAPDWMWYAAALGLFAYQTLDAIDGKQARRTGSSSPLGQLFDHGCDSINIGFSTVLVATALGWGTTVWAWIGFGMTAATFYITTWEEYHSGTLALPLINGPTEGLLMIMGAYSWTGWFGRAWWASSLLPAFTHYLGHETVASTVLPLLARLGMTDINMGQVIVITMFGSAVFTCLGSITFVLRLPEAEPRAALGRILPYAGLLAVGGYFVSTHWEQWEENPSIWLLTAGAAHSYLTMSLILSHLCNEEIRYVFKFMIWMVSVPLFIEPKLAGCPDWALSRVLAVLFPQWRNYAGSVEQGNSEILAWVTILVVWGSYWRFVIAVISDITNYLGISVFKIPYKKKSE